jgi:hypothetical protein
LTEASCKEREELGSARGRSLKAMTSEGRGASTHLAIVLVFLFFLFRLGWLGDGFGLGFLFGFTFGLGFGCWYGRRSWRKRDRSRSRGDCWFGSVGRYQSCCRRRKDSRPRRR